MKITANTIVWIEDIAIPAFNLAIFDLDTGLRIEGVISADTETGGIERHLLDDKGMALINEEVSAFLTASETRRFRVVDTETDREIFRTSAAFDALKAMIRG